MIRASHRQPGYVAAIVNRLSATALTVFLPLHFLALGTALGGAGPLDRFLALTAHPLVKLAEFGLVVALALHLACGLRVLAIELLAARERTAAAVAACFAVGLAGGLLFLLASGTAA